MRVFCRREATQKDVLSVHHHLGVILPVRLAPSDSLEAARIVRPHLVKIVMEVQPLRNIPQVLWPIIQPVTVYMVDHVLREFSVNH